MGRWLAGAALGFAVVISGLPRTEPAVADDDPLAHASKLRNEADADWNAKRYAEAAEKLAQASAIYDGAEGETDADRAITWRALIWNLVRSQDVPRALEFLDRLLALAKEDPAVSGEVDSAFSAMWEAAKSADSFVAGQRTLDQVRDAARRNDNRALWAQATHSLGSLARDNGERDIAATMFGEAIATRRRIGDVVGLVWSLNNLANLHLVNGELDKALAPLAEAHGLVLEEHVAAPRWAIKWNLEKAIELLEKGAVEKAPAWVHERAEVARRSGYGTLVPASQLDREAMRLAGNLQGQDRATKKLLKSIVKLPGDPAIPEVRADLVLRAARLAASHLGAHRDAGKWLKGLELGEGPCRPHLEARLALVRALILARPRGKAGEFAKAATAAADAWRELGDFQGRRNALAALVTAARGAGMLEAIADVVTEEAEARRAGAPGGAGTSAMSGGDRSRAGDVPLDGVALRVFMQPDGQIRIQDQIASYGVARKPAWHAANVCIDGIALTFFGGYVAVKKANYGGGAVAGGASGSWTLEDIPRYMPIPAKLALIVEKNGAVRYAAAR